MAAVARVASLHTNSTDRSPEFLLSSRPEWTAEAANAAPANRNEAAANGNHFFPGIRMLGSRIRRSRFEAVPVRGDPAATIAHRTARYSRRCGDEPGVPGICKNTRAWERVLYDRFLSPPADSALRFARCIRSCPVTGIQPMSACPPRVSACSARGVGARRKMDPQNFAVKFKKKETRKAQKHLLFQRANAGRSLGKILSANRSGLPPGRPPVADSPVLPPVDKQL